MKIVKLINTNQVKAIVRELKSYKLYKGMFISEEDLKNIDSPLMIA